MTTDNEGNSMIEIVNDPHAFAEMWAADETAEAESPSYKAPDGELFRVARILKDGTVVADSGRWLNAGEFNQCRRVA